MPDAPPPPPPPCLVQTTLDLAKDAPGREEAIAQLRKDGNDVRSLGSAHEGRAAGALLVGMDMGSRALTLLD